MPLAAKVERIEPQLLRERVYVAVKRWIVDGILLPGERVRDMELAGRLGVSRMPVREALTRLADEGFVEMVANRWTRVAPADPNDAGRLYPLVWTLETLAIRLAAPRLGDGEVAKMRKANQRLRRAIEAHDAVAASGADRELHAVYIELTGNPELIEMLSSLKAKLRRLEIVYFGGSVIAAKSADEHDELIDALEGRDLDAAVGFIIGNWQQSYERILARGDVTLQSKMHRTEGGKHESRRSLRLDPGRP